MNISGASQSFFSGHAQSGGNISPKTASKATDSIPKSSSPPRNVDLRNVSINEINGLIKSGVEGLLDVVPFISPQIVNQQGAEHAANIKIDFIGQVKGKIEYSKSIGEEKETEFLQKVLRNLKKIDGMKIPFQIDASV